MTPSQIGGLFIGIGILAQQIIMAILLVKVYKEETKI